MRLLTRWKQPTHYCPQRIFAAVSFSEERNGSDSKATPIGNDCLLGQIASFMENLHLTYNEVLDGIPYRNLVIMQKDKQRITSGDVMQEVSDDEFFKGKMKFDE